MGGMGGKDKYVAYRTVGTRRTVEVSTEALLFHGG